MRDPLIYAPPGIPTEHFTRASELLDALADLLVILDQSLTDPGTEADRDAVRNWDRIRSEAMSCEATSLDWRLELRQRLAELVAIVRANPSKIAEHDSIELEHAEDLLRRETIWLMERAGQQRLDL